MCIIAADAKVECTQKGGDSMALIKTPVNGRARFTYPEGRQDMRVNGINPTADGDQFDLFASAVQAVQDADIIDGFLTVEVDIEEE